MAVSVDISKLYAVRDEYPSNLGPKITGTHFSALDGYQRTLRAIEPNLFVQSEEEVEVRFRDLEFEGKARTKFNAHSEEKVKFWLGIAQRRDLASQSEIATATKTDPKSRFIYFFADNSRDNLRVQRSTVALIFTYYRVMPEFLDFLTCFGIQSTLRDVRFSGFRKQVALPRRPGITTAVDALGRSGHQYQVAYNLKGTSPTEDGEWSIRNAAFYHRFDVISGRSLWIVTKGRKDVYQSYEELTGEDGREEDTSFGTTDQSFVSSLAPHLMFARWSRDDWRGYVRELEEAVDRESKMAKLVPREDGYLPRHYKSSDVRRMQIWEEQASEVVVILEGNVDILMSLQQFYRRLARDDRFPFRDSCAGEINDFASNLDTIVSDMKNSISRAKALMKTTADRKELIKQYRVDDEADRMRRLNKNMEREAIVVRIITLVTLVYLPATFVSTLFSTDIIKYQVDNYPDGKYSKVAMDRWLQVTIPLTAITLFAAWYGNGWATKKAAHAVGGDFVGAIEEKGEVGGGVEQSQPLPGNRILAWLRAQRAGLARLTAGSPVLGAIGSKGSVGPYP
ncbi:hypothetical protein B0H67DRAFT_648682 [Lasiosphaeris hirsuta]|uniref:CorA-like transporter domain-containing protein n=1 Tax=Lasiosphaeris hirsuta TaxID=260670 RepID=A0AA40DLZ2_9PEZI|nr:hypothetical protein B0H67DRAFT_648682 [Lasiosphaeris hirsuta]